LQCGCKNVYNVRREEKIGIFINRMHDHPIGSMRNCDIFLVRKGKKMAFKLRCIPLCLFIALFAFQPLYAQTHEALKPRVSIIPTINTEKDDQYEAVCQTIDDTMKLNLDLLRRFVVTIGPSINPYENPENVRKYAIENRMDNVIFGKAFLNEQGNLVFQVSVYDRIKDAITLTREEATTNIFETFDAANRLVEGIVGEFSRMHVGYGDVLVENGGEEGVYSVYVDGEKKGESLKRIEHVLNGEHTIEIRQQRMLGQVTLHTEDVWVYEDMYVKVDFSVPYLLPEEKEELTRLEMDISDYRDDKAEKQRVIARFGELLELFSDVSFCWSLAEERERYRQMEVEYRLQLNRWDMEDNFADPQETVFNDLVEISKSAHSYLDPARIREKVRENAGFFYNSMGVNAAYDFSRKEMEKGYERYTEMDRLAQQIPVTDYHLYEEERGFVEYRIGEKYLGKRHLLKVFVNMKTKNELDEYFGTKLKASSEVLKGFGSGKKDELIVLTNPPGMKVFIDEKLEGPSPVRVTGLKKESVHVSARDPWFEEVHANLDVKNGRNFVFLRSEILKEIDLRSPIILGQEHTQLAWKDFPDTERYSVQIHRSGGNFVEPVFEQKGLKTPSCLYMDGLGERNDYVYRVRGTNRNKVRSPWFYSEKFSDRIKWSFATGGDVCSSSVEAEDGTLFFAANDRCLYALDANGRPLWMFSTGGVIHASPAVGPEGEIYVGSDDHVLYALSIKGDLLWNFFTSGSILASAAVGLEGNVYVGCDDGSLSALTEEGALQWCHHTGGSITRGAAVGPDGTVYVGSSDGGIHALAPDGMLKWVFVTGGSINTTPAVAPDGTVYVGSDDGGMYAFSPDGKLKWVFNAGDSIRSSPVLDSDGTIYFGSADYCLYAVKPDGTAKWIFSAAGPVEYSPVVDSAGTVYFCDCERTVYALFADGTMKWQYSMKDELLTQPFCSSNGCILVGSKNHRLYALEVGIQ
jgi:outer membrane protein assembly factor BamB